MTSENSSSPPPIIPESAADVRPKPVSEAVTVAVPTVQPWADMTDEQKDEATATAVAAIQEQVNETGIPTILAHDSGELPPITIVPEPGTPGAAIRDEASHACSSNPAADAAAGRHPSIVSAARWFDDKHLTGVAAAIVHDFAHFAEFMLDSIKHDDPELTEALRHLMHAKDSAVRAAVAEIAAKP